MSLRRVFCHQPGQHVPAGRLTHTKQRLRGGQRRACIPGNEASATSCKGSKLSPATASASRAALIAWVAVPASRHQCGAHARPGRIPVDEPAPEQRRRHEIVAGGRKPRAQAEQVPGGGIYRYCIARCIRMGERTHGFPCEAERKLGLGMAQQRAESARPAQSAHRAQQPLRPPPGRPARPWRSWAETRAARPAWAVRPVSGPVLPLLAAQ